MIHIKNTQRAFTIIELLVTVAVLAVLVGIAIPSFSTFIANTRASTLGNDAFVALNLARSEAFKRGGRVSLCVGSTGAGCAGSDWRNGWIIFTDDAASDTAVPVVGTVIRQWDQAPSGAQIAVTKAGVALTYIRFTGQGMLARSPADSDPVAIDIYQSGCQGNARRTLQIGIAGRVSQASAACP